MSWQEYVDDHLMCELPNGGTLKSAAIVGLDGGVWAQSADFPALGDDEVAKIVKGFTDPSVLATGGLYLGGVKYLSISPDPAVIRGKKGQDGVTVKKTVSALVIGIYGEGVQPADGNIVVENLADYLTNTGI
ncbi:Profilin/allergen [Coccomyxa subellipsoidea C-169]|uniref:Profilin n=1 Tax=Coccomyxa subellipsoidea (strain C-169) TaxID=574566 RepID=I0YXD3_COCSC|nr:Profilin/allergen [Coccomyxa subellipsoidea C-169]EIE23052.1 Profilin/allergen [Coccomyxa subellipsoidea C-169]|eukprot:XP_005647596.1 Profilin/allergen [Coccomyxa subellipsoidea C-169]